MGPPGYAAEETDNAEDSGDASSKKDEKASKAAASGGTTESEFSRQAGETDQQYEERLNQAAARLGLPGKRISERLEDFMRRLYDASPTYLKQRNDESRVDYQQRMDQAARDLNLPGQHPGESLADFAKRVGKAAEEMHKGQDEATKFQEATTSIRQAIQSIPDLKELAKNLVVDNTPEGLRIQIIDQEQTTMFAAGSNQMTPQAQQLMVLLAKAIGKLPNKLTITGHTDGKPFQRAGRDNWDLSTERANASRRALVAAGIDESRIESVAGRADRELLIPSDPASPKNRRIGIILLREAKSPAPPTGGG